MYSCFVFLLIELYHVVLSAFFFLPLMLLSFDNFTFLTKEEIWKV